MRKFARITGATGRLPTNANHLNFKWLEPGCAVLFSASRQGGGMSCHFTSDKAGMVKITNAINDFCAFVFENCSWCEMILAKVNIEKVKKIITNCNFIWTLSTKHFDLYTRRR